MSAAFGVGLLFAATFTLGGCREFPSDGSVSTHAEVASRDTAAPTSPSAVAPVVQATTAPSPVGRVEVKAERASSEDEPRVIEPWRLVGRPYLVADDRPAIEASPGVATYTLWFRTRAEFRGVRLGTSIAADDHYKVGFITIDELPAYVPRGVGIVVREARLVRQGRYCYSAALHVQGRRGSRNFPVQEAGTRLKVKFDLRGAPPQTRMAPVVSEPATSAGLSAPERALGCRA